MELVPPRLGVVAALASREVVGQISFPSADPKLPRMRLPPGALVVMWCLLRLLAASSAFLRDAAGAQKSSIGFVAG
jgi:hypothetical protein